MSSEDAVWTVAEQMYGKLPVLFRYRNFAQSFAREHYPHRLNIFWSVSGADATELPGEPELERMKGLGSTLDT